MALTPTAEQSAIIDAFQTGDDVAVTAMAGTGKTSTLKMLAASRPHLKMNYVAFNRAIAEEASRSFVPNVTCKTMHALAFAAVGKKFADRLNAARQPAWKVAEILDINQPFEFDGKALRSNSLARLTLDTIGRFCHSADPEPKPYHVPKVEGMTSPEVRQELLDLLYPHVLNAWSDLTKVSGGKLRFTHDVYLKLWSMQDPKLPGSVVLFDEAQDADPVIAQIVAAQDAQKIYVGDENQTIYEWRGSSDVLTSVDVPHRLPLQQSFRFGPAIADEANRVLTELGTDLRVLGFDKIESKLVSMPDPDAVLCRTNAEAISRLMNAQIAGIRAGLVGGTTQVENLAKAAQDLTAGEKTSHPELMAFENWTQVQEYVSEDPDAKELCTLVKLVDQHGADRLLEAVAQAVPEQFAHLVISTAHKAKGREWDRVSIAGDFPSPKDDEDGGGALSAGELRLAYVAVTRAKTYLDSQSLSWIQDIAKELGQVRVFVPAPEREAVAIEVPLSEPNAQVVPDPTNEGRIMFVRTPYNKDLVDAQRGLKGRRYFPQFEGESKVNVVWATHEAIEVAERFNLSISDAARQRVATMSEIA